MQSTDIEPLQSMITPVYSVIENQLKEFWTSCRGLSVYNARQTMEIIGVFFVYLGSVGFKYQRVLKFGEMFLEC